MVVGVVVDAVGAGGAGLAAALGGASGALGGILPQTALSGWLGAAGPLLGAGDLTWGSGLEGNLLAAGAVMAVARAGVDPSDGAVGVGVAVGPAGASALQGMLVGPWELLAPPNTHAIGVGDAGVGGGFVAAGVAAVGPVVGGVVCLLAASLGLLVAASQAKAHQCSSAPMLMLRL